jgi:death-on-curing family protein
MSLAFKHPEIAEEHARWIRLASEERGTEGELAVSDVLDVHFIIVDMFFGQREGLGGIGPKDLGLLSSAVSRQNAGFGDYSKWNTVEEKAATLLYGLVLNHPFHDANKRTGFLTTLFYLQKCGRFPKVTAKQFEDFVVMVADRQFRTLEKFKRSFEGQEDADIKYIAYYIRYATRQLDKRDYIITFNDLDRILKRFGYKLHNPSGNYIDVVHFDGDDVGNKVCQVGFPSAKKQVTRQAIKTVRQATGLTVLNGVDSQVFFNDVEPISQLLAKYYEPLQRLADR